MHRTATYQTAFARVFSVCVGNWREKGMQRDLIIYMHFPLFYVKSLYFIKLSFQYLDLMSKSNYSLGNGSHTDGEMTIPFRKSSQSQTLLRVFGSHYALD